ncbi:hypothetical protein EDC94DRAFT_620056 [Helicostylum pulchrum]|nr:hypothetical protein EDC94DRAFT_620056 [Helicostylum pulchrum]
MSKSTSSSKKTAWKGIQKKSSDVACDRAESIGSQDSQKNSDQKTFRSRSSSIASETFEDAVDEDEEDEDDDYFQDEEEDEEEKQRKEVLKMKELAIEQDKKRNQEKSNPNKSQVVQDEPVAKPTRMSIILPALQNHGFSDDDDSSDNESLKDPNEKAEERPPQSTADLVAEIEALEVATAPVAPVTPRSPTTEKPTTYEPIPIERPYKPPTPAVESPAIPVRLVAPVEEKKVTMEDVQKEIQLTAAAVAAVNAVEIHTETVTQEHKATPKNPPPGAAEEFKAIEEHTTDLNGSGDSGISVSRDTTARSSNDTVQDEESVNHLAAILPAVQESVRHAKNEEESLPAPSRDQHILPDDRERAKHSREFEFSIEDPIDLDLFRDNVIAIQAIDPKDIPVNNLKPREQEEADEPVRDGMKYLFDNKFMKAKAVFQTKASIDPLYALGLGAMAFIKAIMTYHESDVEIAMNALATAYTIAKTQIDNTSFKKPFKDTVSTYFTTLLSTNSTGLPKNPPAMAMPNSSGGVSSPNAFTPNGVLRAHVVKAECCLLMGILQMTQESVVGYLKCGLNLRRAYNSYSLVWQEYKRMGQEYTKYMDCDTVSAIQFGIGAVHLIMSSMPPKILKIFSTLGWKSDKQLGFALLKLCLEGRGIRAPLASLTLLAYYSVLTSFAPQLYAKDMMSPAIECLLDAQSIHPNSCFFLFFAARIARVARNLPLSTQSMTFAAESSRGEWAEVAMKQMSDYEIGFNLALQLDWEGAASYFDQLSREKYWSPAFSKYFVGACYEMLGQRTEAILCFAEVPELSKEDTRKTYIDAYVLKKVEFFQKSGYQDMDFSLPGLEIMLVLNAFEYMEKESLEKCLEMVQHTLEIIYDREKIEYNIRLRELVPSTTPPDYYDQRSVLLLTKASILNSLGRFEETIAHLNWVLDHKHCVKEETWVIPFTYWESGVTSWGLGNLKKSRKLWQMAMSCTKYDFEYRMAVRLSLALSKCDEIGVTHIDDKDIKGASTNGRKRMPILNTF